MNWPELIDQMASGSVPALSRLITLIENREPGWHEVMQRIYPAAQRATTVGITGYPGSGKSTLTGQLALELTQRGKRVGIIAIDPSSHLTGGAFLGDRVRMNDISALEGVFIRSMGARGKVGGLHPAVRDVIKILDAFGKDFILVETIGVGQDEIDITKTTQIVVLVCAPGQGDAIQYLKAGVLETADIYVANKSDLPDAEHVVNHLRGVLRQGADDPKDQAPILQTIATQGVGLAALAEAIEAMAIRPRFKEAKRREMAREDITSLLKARVDELARLHWLSDDQLGAAVDTLMSGQVDPYSLADDMIIKGIERLQRHGLPTAEPYK